MSKATHEWIVNVAFKISELESAVERLIVENAGLKEDWEESNARLAVREAKCRLVRGGRGENGIRRSCS